MSTDGHDAQSAELEREFVSNALAGLKDDATQEQVELTLKRLRQLRERAEQRQFGSEDWALLEALLRKSAR